MILTSLNHHVLMPYALLQMDRTERIKNCLDPKFSKRFLIDYYFELVQKLKFGVYDIDNATVELGDDDFLGEFECTLGQVGIKSGMQILDHCFVTFFGFCPKIWLFI